MKILLSFGTRPEAIKMAPVCFELSDRKIEHKICVTAQHREMLDQVLDFFEISPDYDLNLMKSEQSLNELSSKIIVSIDRILEKENPDLILVQGDTTTAVVVALAAFYRGIKVGHVEAGLRTYDKKSPFPEEMNRQILGRVADLHFAPTSKAVFNLLNEGIPEANIFLTGNTVVDALNWGKRKTKGLPPGDEIEKVKFLLGKGRKMVLVTGHRRENFGIGLKNICAALLELVKTENINLIYTVHLNPNVSNPVREILGDTENIHLIPPVSYPAMLWLMDKADLIISDSGGLQEEVPAFGKSLLVTREVTERPEGLEAGFSILVGSDVGTIIREARKILNQPLDLTHIKNPFGDGMAAVKIVDAILHNYSYSNE